MADVQARPFGVRFDEAIRFLQGKLPEASLAWDSLAGPVHAKVFTVAGATTADLAADLQQSLVSALNNGTTITQFRREFDATVQRYGWSYNGKRGWRTSVIFDTNMRTAHMAGRWAQLQANADRRPYLQYRTAGDAKVRPQHRQWNGRIYPISDAFWQTHYPPNGWGCRCTVRAYSQADLDAKGLSVSQPLDIKTRSVRNRDGDVVDQVPVGIDPGWDHNVGQAWVAPEVALGAKLARLPRELQGLLVDKTITPAYQAALAERFTAFREANKTAIEAGELQGQAQIVGFLDSATLDGLARVAPALQLQSTAISVAGAQVPMLVIDAAWLDQLPTHLRSYQAVVWDQLKQQLLVVVPGERDEAAQQIVLRPNVDAPGGSAWLVQSVAPVSAEQSLGDSGRYRVLVGRVR